MTDLRTRLKSCVRIPISILTSESVSDLDIYRIQKVCFHSIIETLKLFDSYPFENNDIFIQLFGMNREIVESEIKRFVNLSKIRDSEIQETERFIANQNS